MRVNFQYISALADDRRRELVRELEAKGARGVGPMFAGETDPDLALLHVLDAPDERGPEILRHLRSSGCVQFAETEKRRGIA